MRIEIDDAACTGHGRCYSLVPELFDCDDLGHGRVTRPEVPPASEPAAQRAEVNCPERAIKLRAAR